MLLRDLSYFAVIARHGHMGRAAESLGLSQPALTKSVKRLEREVGAPLLTRTPKGVHPTPAGETFLERARQIQLVADEARREVADVRDGNAGLVRIGAGPSMIRNLLPAAFARLHRRMPGLGFKVAGGMNDSLIAMLRRGDIDLVLSALPRRAPEGIEQEVLDEEEVAVLVRAGHPLLGKRRVPLAALAAAQWVLPRPGTLAVAWLGRLFEDRGLRAPRVAVETDSIAFLLEAVAATDLLGFASRELLASRSDVRVLPVADAVLPRRIGLSWRAGAYLPPAAQQLREALRASVRPKRNNRK